MSVVPNVVSLFSGAGGMDLGLASAGWRIRAQVEMDEDASATLRLHAATLGYAPEVISKQIEEVNPSTLRKNLDLPRGELTLLAGGPPCQPFTTTGLRKALSDRRASSVFPTYLSFVDEFLPRAILIENVDGMLSAALRHRPLSERGPGKPVLAESERKGSFLRWFLGELARRGYSVSWGVAEAADYGVPQFRQRAILIGVRDGEPCFLPTATHGGPDAPPFITVREALSQVRELGGVQPLSERKRAVYAMVPPGGNWRDLPEHVQRATMGKAYHAEGGKSGWWRRLAWDAPAPTILGMPDHSSTGLIHPEDTRCLSVGECAALQSFPVDVRFAGKSRSQYQQIGNAVPPKLAEALGRRLLEWFEGGGRTVPDPPEWRPSSANRRIGTHGWVLAHSTGARYHLHGRVRDDHVWSRTGPEPGSLFA